AGSYTSNPASVGAVPLSGAPSNAGAYTVDVHYTSDNLQYTDADSGPIGFTISKVNAAINVSNYSSSYDGQAHGLTGTATGVKGEDLSDFLNLGPTFTNAGHYSGGWIFGQNINYRDASGPVSVDIAQAGASITITPYSGVYDGQAHGLS